MIAVLRIPGGRRIVLSGPIAAVQDCVDNAVAQGARIERLSVQPPKRVIHPLSPPSYNLRTSILRGSRAAQCST
jgi:hypothetical protein